jgi:hypothetical protein
MSDELLDKAGLRLLLATLIIRLHALLTTGLPRSQVSWTKQVLHQSLHERCDGAEIPMSRIGIKVSDLLVDNEKHTALLVLSDERRCRRYSHRATDGYHAVAFLCMALGRMQDVLFKVITEVDDGVSEQITINRSD